MHSNTYPLIMNLLRITEIWVRYMPHIAEDVITPQFPNWVINKVSHCCIRQGNLVLPIKPINSMAGNFSLFFADKCLFWPEASFCGYHDRESGILLAYGIMGLTKECRQRRYMHVYCVYSYETGWFFLHGGVIILATWSPWVWCHERGPASADGLLGI